MISNFDNINLTIYFSSGALLQEISTFFELDDIFKELFIYPLAVYQIDSMSLKDQKIVGENFTHLEEFVRYKWGQDGLDQFRKVQKENIANFYSEKFYPLEEYIELLEAMQEIFDDENLAFNIGWHRARNLVLAKGRQAQGLEVLQKIVTAWRKFVNFGRISVEQLPDETFSVVISDYFSHPLYCERMRGFFAGLVGDNRMDQRNINKISCVCQGDDRCEYNLRV